MNRAFLLINVLTLSGISLYAQTDRALAVPADKTPPSRKGLAHDVHKKVTIQAAADKTPPSRKGLAHEVHKDSKIQAASDKTPPSRSGLAHEVHKKVTVLVKTVAAHQVLGTLTLVDSGQNQIGVTPRVGSEVKLKVDSTTKVIINGQPAGVPALGDEAVGKRVVVVIQRGSTPPLAQLVVVLGYGPGGASAP